MANRFWVGGTGNWSDTNHWSAISGGAGGASVPTAVDDAFFDSLSALANYTVTMDGGSNNCRDLTTAAPATGNLTIGGIQPVNISGSLTLYAGLIWTHQISTVTFNATTGTRTLTSAGTTIGSPISFNGVGGVFQLQDNLTTTALITLAAGTWDTNAKTVAAARFNSSNSTTRVLTITNSSLTFTSAGNNSIWNTATTTNLTINASGSTVTLVSTENSTLAFSFPLVASFGGITLNNLTFSCAVYAHLQLAGNVTVSGQFNTSGGNANTQRLHLYSSVPGTARSITCNGTTIAQNTDFEDVTIAGTASPMSGASLGNCGGCSGITFTAPVTRHWVGNGGNFTDTAHWSTASGGAGGASMPLPHDTIRLDASSFSSAAQTITPNVNFLRVGSFSSAGVTNSPTFNINNTTYFFGDLNVTGLGGLGTSDMILAGRGVCTLTDSLSHLNQYRVDAFGGSWSLGAHLSNVGGLKPTLALVRGSFDANDFDLYLNTFGASNANTRTLRLGNGTWYLTSTSTHWDITLTAGLTFFAEGSTIECQGGTGLSCTFAGGGLVYNNLRINKTGAGAMQFTGSNTFNIFSRISATNHNILFTAGTTTTLADFQVSGTAGNLAVIGSITAANHNLVKTGGGVIDRNFLSISRSQASPASTWYAGANSTDGGNNSGWIFTAAPSQNQPSIIIIPGAA